MRGIQVKVLHTFDDRIAAMLVEAQKTGRCAASANPRAGSGAGYTHVLLHAKYTSATKGFLSDE
jgi:hypothetical protein